MFGTILWIKNDFFQIIKLLHLPEFMQSQHNVQYPYSQVRQFQEILVTELEIETNEEKMNKRQVCIHKTSFLMPLSKNIIIVISKVCNLYKNRFTYSLTCHYLILFIGIYIRPFIFDIKCDFIQKSKLQKENSKNELIAEPK